ncbi:MAG: AAA family ATPase [Eubacterium sp.]|nr:AAA family ATPase [Eubacterium sp.]
MKISVGKEYFDEIRRSGSYYVDKTELIYELLAHTDNAVTLFTRPRRFGKTVMMSMLENFFNINKDSRDLFQNLRITAHEDFCREWMNRYPTIFISLKDVDGSSFSAAFEMMRTSISDLCIKHSRYIEFDSIDPADHAAFQRLKYKKSDISEIKHSLNILMRILYTTYDRPVVLLIDEYDVPLDKAREKGYYGEMLDLLRGLLSTSLKTNDYIKFAVITGCLRIAKESIFTGVNNFMSYSVLDEDFSEYFGFTQDEVDHLLEAAGREEKASTFKEWYDGYIFGDSRVYCPWDVAGYIQALLKREHARPKNYWLNTGNNSIVREFVGAFDVDRKFEILLNGGRITQTISDQLTYDRLLQTEDNLWSVLLMTGYLTKADPDQDGETVDLKIPNMQISRIFSDAVISYFTDTLETDKVDKLMEALWNGDITEASRILSDMLMQTISYMDYHEDYYHAFLAGVFVGRGYEVESNKEKGLGRPDILLTDKKKKRAMIIEAKKADSPESLDRDADKALQQIVDEKYAQGVGVGYEDILCFGVSFYQKTAYIRQL